MTYNKLNNSVGWLVFLIATIVYFITLESTASLWDCGEYITAANKLEVGHPPGAPLFMILGRLFSFFAEPDMVAIWINRLSALSSSFTILFMYWSITMFAKKMLQRTSRDWSFGDQIAAVGAGAIGGLAYAFSDSFWFSAVEGEVYAMSSLFTAAIFWAILKWDSEMIAIKHAELKPDRSPMRWMILIMFLFGLAIGVHLLGLLAVPAIAYVMYFNLWEKTTLKGIIATGIISVVALGFIQEGVIPGIVAIASGFEVSFVNSFGLPFYTGTIFFFILLIAGFVWGFRYAVRKAKPILSTALWGLAVLLIGYSSFAVIVIRSNANTPLDENDPENLVTLHAYLKREQYGSWPILNGPYFNSNPSDPSTYGDLSPFYLRRFVVEQSGIDFKAFKDESKAQAFAKEKGAQYTVTEKYFSSNEKVRKNNVAKYEETTFLPRMFYTSSDPNDPKIEAYKNWSGYDPTEKTEGALIGKDGNRIPTFGENMTYMMSYQVNWMYWRYFMWNFSGRQNDIQGHGDAMRGNWISGYSFIDNDRIGDQESAPHFTKNNMAHNNFWMLPLILGIVGMIFHFYRAPKDAFVILLTFLFTGMAIVIYLNQKPFEPRERDYAYAASFYAFAMWIGISVIALYEAYKNFKIQDWRGMGIGVSAVSGFVLICALGEPSTVIKSWLLILGIGAGILGFAYILRKIIPNHAAGAVVLTLIAGIVPYIMGNQGWDDHDRSGKTSARDLAFDYLMSCAPNSILFTAGDNDTFPLWYYQEVEGKRTDVRVCNTSLFDTDWYTEQMMLKTYKSEPLPISFREDQILMFAGGTDQALFASTLELNNSGGNRDEIERLFEIKKSSNKAEFSRAFNQFQQVGLSVFASAKAADPTNVTVSSRITELQNTFNVSADSADLTAVEAMNNAILEVFDAYRNGLLTADQNALQSAQQALYEWEKPWALLPLDEAMKFIHNDANMIDYNGSELRVFPCSGFIVPVNAKNAVSSGLITQAEAKNCATEIRFNFEARGITKSDLMILDMMNNNDWKRAMYFSSPSGTDVSMALYKNGFLRQNGMAWEISPIAVDPNQPYSPDVMFNNMMHVYTYGEMKDPGVLTDYYARRQTTQFRSQFAQLAEYYLGKSNELAINQDRFTPAIKNMRAAGQSKQADSLENTIKNADARIATYNKKAIQLIQRSLEVMPANVVLDYGEQAQRSRNIQGPDGLEYYLYQDGNLHDYVSILFRAGDKTGAEALGKEVIDQLESTMTYFTTSDASFAGKNFKDYAATVSAYIQIQKIANDPIYGNPTGTLANRTAKGLDQLYTKDLERIYKELETASRDNGEIGRTSNGYYNSLLNNLRGNMEAMGVYYKVIEANTSQMPGGLPGNAPLSPSEAILTEAALNPKQEMDDSAI